MKPILVIGSSNTDMVIRVCNLPQPGQTVLGKNFQMFGGGKGANQAVAAQRAGGDVRFVAAVGSDDFGRAALETLSIEGIDTRYVQTLDGLSSGVAMIFVADSGENCIGVAPGANNALTPEYLHSHEQIFADISVLLVQLETPIETVAAAIELATQQGATCILNPAPATPVPDRVIEALFCITPNESEAEMLTGVTVTDEKSAAAAADELLQRGVKNVVITMGKNGALLRNASGSHRQTAESVNVVDTTAAGDTFNGVLATMLAKDRSMRDAIGIAVAAATQSVQIAGAIASIPHLGKL